MSILTPDPQAEQAKALCKTILSHIKCAPDSAKKFALNVEKTTRGIEEWVVQNNYVTTNQVTALYNMWKRVNHWKTRDQGK